MGPRRKEGDQVWGDEGAARWERGHLRDPVAALPHAVPYPIPYGPVIPA